MAFDLVAANQSLDLVLKVVLLGLLVMVAVLVRDVDRAIRSGERAASSVTDTVEKLGEGLILGSLYKRFKGWKGRDE